MNGNASYVYTCLYVDGPHYIHLGTDETWKFEYPLDVPLDELQHIIGTTLITNVHPAMMGCPTMY